MRCFIFYSTLILVSFFSTPTINANGAGGPVPKTECRRSCDTWWISFEGKCLKLRTTPKNYTSSYKTCRDEYGGTLLTIRSEDEQILLEQLFAESAGGNTSTNTHFLYLGSVRCPHKGFQWLGPHDIEFPMIYQNWMSPAQPGIGDNENCLGFNMAAKTYTGNTYGGWSVIRCSQLYPFVCQKPANFV